MARLSPYAFFQQFDNNGDPLSGGKVYTYEAGTTTPKTTYTGADGLVANSNPVILDSAGRADIWLDSGSYKFILKSSADVTIDTIDNLVGDTANAFGSSVVSISGNLTITSAYKNNVIIATATATLSLPSAASAEDGFYFVIKNDSASSLVTIDPNLSELIDGAATATVRAGQSAIVICNGTGWNTIFLDSLNIFANSITTSGATGIVLKNSGGTTVATFGASNGTVSTLAGNLSVAGTATAVASINVSGNSTAAGVLTLAEDTDNGTNKVTITAPQSIASDYTVITPSSAGILALTSERVYADRAYAEYTANTGLATIIPLDDTMPQVGEGTEILSAIITPKTTTNRIRVRVCLSGGSSASANISLIAAVFVNGAANAIVAKSTVMSNNDQQQELVINFEHIPASTSAQTYSVRVGGSSGTIRLNGLITGRLLGGAQRCTLILEELVA